MFELASLVPKADFFDEENGKIVRVSGGRRLLAARRSDENEAEQRAA